MKNNSVTIHRKLTDLFWTSAVNSPALQKSLSSLSLDAQRALYLRFWESMTIEEIARDMRKTWDETDFMIRESLKALKESLNDLPAAVLSADSAA